MNTPNNAAALELLENEWRERAKQYYGTGTIGRDAYTACANELATLRATLAQPDATRPRAIWPDALSSPERHQLRVLLECVDRRVLSLHEADQLVNLIADALTSQPSGEAVAWLITWNDGSKCVSVNKCHPDDGTCVPLNPPSADAPGVAVDEAMVGRFKMACRALMGLRGQRSTVYAEDLETMVDVLRVLESVATLPVVNEAMVGRAYSAFANAKVADPTDTRARIRFALIAALAPKPEGWVMESPRELELLRRVKAGEPEGEWLPIESAPKNGTRIAIKFKSGREYEANWQTTYGGEWHVDSFKHLPWSDQHEITHWKALQEPRHG